MGVFVAGTAVAMGVASVPWPLIAVVGVLGVYVMLAPLLGWRPWHQREASMPLTGITARGDVTAGTDIETDGPLNARGSVHAGRRIQSATDIDSLVLAAAKQQSASRVQLGIVNPLVGNVLIRQHAEPLEENEAGCVIRVVIAGNREPSDPELKSATKNALKDALARSGIENWVSTRAKVQQPDPVTDWALATPNSGRVVTFKRDWGILCDTGSTLRGQATLQLPPLMTIGQRVLLILDVIERGAYQTEAPPRLHLSLAGLVELLHTLSKTAIDELAAAVFPLIYRDGLPSFVGPNYEIQFGDRELDSFVQIPSSFTRPTDAHTLAWANINTPQDSDAHDFAARDEVLCQGLESVLRSNGYDDIEDEITKLKVSGLHPKPTPTADDRFRAVFGNRRGPS